MLHALKALSTWYNSKDNREANEHSITKKNFFLWSCSGFWMRLLIFSIFSHMILCRIKLFKKLIKIPNANQMKWKSHSSPCRSHTCRITFYVTEKKSQYKYQTMKASSSLHFSFNTLRWQNSFYFHWISFWKCNALTHTHALELFSSSSAFTNCAEHSLCCRFMLAR